MNSEPKEMKVTLVTAPQHPIGTLYYIWKQSRSNKPLPSPKEIEDILSCDLEGDIPGSIVRDSFKLGFESGVVI